MPGGCYHPRTTHTESKDPTSNASTFSRRGEQVVNKMCGSNGVFQRSACVMSRYFLLTLRARTRPQ